MTLLLAAMLTATLDPIFWSASTVWIEPEDDFGSADRPIAACLAKHLADQLPMTVASSKETADVVYRVRGNLPSATARYFVGAMGGSPSAHLTVLDRTGRELWNDGAKLRRAIGRYGKLDSADGDLTVHCGLADELLDTVREAMKKARGKR